MTNLELSYALALDAKPCPFIHNVEKMSEPKRSIKITDHFTCTSANVIYCITSTYAVKVTDCENTFATSKEMTRTHPNQSLDTYPPNYFKQHIWQFAAFPNIQAVRKATKHLNKNLSSKSALLISTVSTSAFQFTNLIFSRHHIPTNSVAPFSAYKPTNNPQFLQSL